MIYFLAIILALLPTYQIRFQIFGLPTTLLELLIVVFLLIAAKYLNQQSIEKIKSLGWINIAAIGFVLAGLMATIVSPEQAKALGQLKAFIIEPILFFYAILITIKSKEQLNTTLRWLFLSAGVISLFGLIQYATFVHLPLRFWGNGSEVLRITSLFGYPNALALYLAPLLGFFFTLAISKYELFKNKWWTWAGLILMASGLLLTFSRGGVLAVALILGLLLIKQFGLKKTLPVMLLVLVLLFLVPPLHQRIKLGISDPSSEVHFNLWKVAGHKILKNPILGTGLASFKADNVNYPHNIFLNFWLGMGLLGLVSFSAIVFLAWQKVKTNPNVLTFASGIFFLILVVHGLVDVPYFKNDLSVLFWFMVAVAYI